MKFKNDPKAIYQTLPVWVSQNITAMLLQPLPVPVEEWPPTQLSHNTLERDNMIKHIQLNQAQINWLPPSLSLSDRNYYFQPSIQKTRTMTLTMSLWPTRIFHSWGRQDHPHIIQSKKSPFGFLFIGEVWYCSKYWWLSFWL